MQIPTPERVEEERFRHSLHERRRELKLSMGELARRMVDAGWPEFHQATISRIEKGQRPVRLGEARTLARILEQPLGYMLAGDDEAKLVQKFWAVLRSVQRRRGQALLDVRLWEDSKRELRATLEQLDNLDESEAADGESVHSWGEAMRQARTLADEDIEHLHLDSEAQNLLWLFEEWEEPGENGAPGV